MVAPLPLKGVELTFTSPSMSPISQEGPKTLLPNGSEPILADASEPDLSLAARLELLLNDEPSPVYGDDDPAASPRIAGLWPILLLLDTEDAFDVERKRLRAL